MTTLLLLAAGASASPSYPADLAAEVPMPCVPPCTVCHDSNLGGAGTVTTPFGTAMTDRGLEGGGQTELLVSALAATESDAVDGDRDGIPDGDALAAGDDPNGGPPLCDAVGPTYGCFNQSQAPITLLAVALSAAGVRRRKALGATRTTPRS